MKDIYSEGQNKKHTYYQIQNHMTLATGRNRII